LPKQSAKPSGIQNSIARCFFWISRPWILGKVADLPLALNLTIGWLPISSKNLGKGRFAGTISSHQTDLVSGGDAEGNLAHESSGTYGDLKVFDAKQSTNPSFACKSNSLQSSLDPLGRIEDVYDYATIWQRCFD
jgi:hypothetical protein